MGGMSVKDVKKRIIERHWHKGLPSVERVETLRLFAGGVEIGGRDAEDLRSLSEAGLAVSQDTTTSRIHLVIVLKTDAAVCTAANLSSSARESVTVELAMR